MNHWLAPVAQSLAALLCLLSSATQLAAQNPLAARHDRERTAHDARHYEIQVRLADSGSVFSATVTTHWRLTDRAPIRINLDSTYRIASLTVDGQPARYRRADPDLLLVDLPAAQRDSATTRIEYHGAPPKFLRPGRNQGQDDGLVQRGHGATRKIFADNWPDRARRWLAAQDHPSDKATVAWTIDAPTGLTVVANGTLKGREPAGTGLTRWRFTIDQPIPVYTMVLGAARLAKTPLAPAACATRCIPVSIYTYPEDSAFAVAGPFSRATEMIDYFSSIFGPYPYDELRHVQSSTIFGGMENSTVIFYDEGGYTSRRMTDGLVAHETAHQWFGNSATEADWHHLWLSEGFATYAAALWAGHTRGDSALRNTMANNREAVLRSGASDRPIIDPDATDLLGLLNTNNYPKGAWVLHTLRSLVGDSVFFRGIRRYYREHTHGTALSADFARIMSEESRQDLTWYFTQALTQPGFPTLAVSTTLANGTLTVTLTQTQKPSWGLFRLPDLTVQLDGPAGRRLTTSVTERVTTIRTNWTGSTPPAVTLDPDGRWLLDTGTP
ncbi:MAG: M1 family metallopeptidase [Gemmatimonadales bacterium]